MSILTWQSRGRTPISSSRVWIGGANRLLALRENCPGRYDLMNPTTLRRSGACARTSRLRWPSSVVGLATAALFACDPVAADGGSACNRVGVPITWTEQVLVRRVPASADQMEISETTGVHRQAKRVVLRLCIDGRGGQAVRVPENLGQAIAELRDALPRSSMKLIAAQRFTPALRSTSLTAGHVEDGDLQAAADTLTRVWRLDETSSRQSLNDQMRHDDLIAMDLIVGAAVADPDSPILPDLSFERWTKILARADAEAALFPHPSCPARVGSTTFLVQWQGSPFVRQLPVVSCASTGKLHGYLLERGWFQLSKGDMCVLRAASTGQQQLAIKNTVHATICAALVRRPDTDRFRVLAPGTLQFLTPVLQSIER